MVLMDYVIIVKIEIIMVDIDVMVKEHEVSVFKMILIFSNYVTII